MDRPLGNEGEGKGVGVRGRVKGRMRATYIHTPAMILHDTKKRERKRGRKGGGGGGI